MPSLIEDQRTLEARARMIHLQLVARGIRDPRVLSAIAHVPREVFIPAASRGAAYEDSPQPVGCGQTISQPFIVARMLELLEIGPDDAVLEVGTGTGYQAALLGHMAKRVVTIERHPELAERARENMATLGLKHVEVRTGDGTLGAPDRAPFDAVIVAASGPQVPPSLVAQLAPGGRLICPVGSQYDQRLVLVTRSDDGSPDHVRELDPVVFVPLIGAEGWDPAQASR